MRSGVEREDAHDRATWASMLRERFVSLDVVDPADDRFHGDVASWSLGHLMLSQVRSGPQVIRRSSALVRSDHRAYLQVGAVRTGRAVVTQDGRQARLGPGDFVVYETTRPFTWALEPDGAQPLWQLDVFTWPRDSISVREADSRLVTGTAMPGATGLSGLLSQMLRGLITERPSLAPPGAAALADQVGDLLGILVDTVVTDDDRPPHADLLARIDRYIGDHLDDPDLSPDSVARAHAVSVRQLHRVFAARRLTVARTIRSRRLEQCRRELVAPALAGRSVTQIALRWGFTDLGAFGRSFREAYGVSPRAYRTRAELGLTTPPSPGPHR